MALLLGVTGEEDESISSELKGVKLFVKRGRKEFTDGNFGHIKILTQNERTRLRKSMLHCQTLVLTTMLCISVQAGPIRPGVDECSVAARSAVSL